MNASSTFTSHEQVGLYATRGFIALGIMTTLLLVILGIIQNAEESFTYYSSVTPGRLRGLMKWMLIGLYFVIGFTFWANSRFAVNQKASFSGLEQAYKAQEPMWAELQDARAREMSLQQQLGNERIRAQTAMKTMETANPPSMIAPFSKM